MRHASKLSPSATLQRLPSRGESTAAGYDRLARWYAILERLRFGSKLQHWRTKLLSELPAVQKTLLLGDGDGRFLRALAERQGSLTSHRGAPLPVLMSVDISRAMLQRQEAQVASLRDKISIRFKQADVLTEEIADEQFDLVSAIFFLDCFSEVELQLVISKIHKLLADGGRLYVVDFHQPQTGPVLQQGWIHFWLRVMHTWFRWTTGLEQTNLIPLDPLLTEAGFQPTIDKFDQLGWIRASLWQKVGV